MTQPPEKSSPSSDEMAWTATELAANPHQQADKAERVRHMFGSIARSYDLNNRVHSFGLDQRWRRKTVALCNVRPTDEILDVACGTGDLTEAFAKAGPASTRGLDFTEAMLQIARDKSALKTWPPGISRPVYVQGDAMMLPQEDQSVDIVSIAFGIRNVSNPEKALQEFRRVLRPGGRLAVLEFSEPSNGVLRWLNRLYTHRIMPFTATLLARDRSGAYRYLPRSVATFRNREEFTQLLRDTGFSQISVHPWTFGTCVTYLAFVPDEAR